MLYPGNLAKEILRALDISRESHFPLIVYGASRVTRSPRTSPGARCRCWSISIGPKKEPNSDPEDEEPLRVLRLRDRAPGTPAAFEKAGVKFAFSSGGIRAANQLLPKVRAAIDKGLSPQAALRALTLSAGRDLWL